MRGSRGAEAALEALSGLNRHKVIGSVRARIGVSVGGRGRAAAHRGWGSPLGAHPEAKSGVAQAPAGPPPRPPGSRSGPTWCRW